MNADQLGAAIESFIFGPVIALLAVAAFVLLLLFVGEWLDSL